MAGFCPRFFIDEAGAGGFLRADFLQASLESESLLDSSSDLSGEEFELSEADAYHARRVLRLRKGETCEVVVGTSVYVATLSPEDETVRVVLVRRLEEAAAGPRYRTQVGIVQAVVKPPLVDQIIEKGTEVGASFFLLAPSAGSLCGDRSMREEKLVRWQRIALEAAKQSKRVAVPAVVFCRSLTEVYQRLCQMGVISVVLHPEAESGLGELLEELAPSLARVALWVGPEGGWSAGELESFVSQGMRTARLGRSILRAETAGPVAVAVTRFMLNDW